jgi:hypothetical protein
MWEMPFPISGKSAVVSDCEVISMMPEGEDFDKRKACIVLREAWLCTKISSSALTAPPRAVFFPL